MAMYKVPQNTSVLDVALNVSGSVAGLPAVIDQIPVGDLIGFDNLPGDFDDIADAGQSWTPDLQGFEIDLNIPVYNTLGKEKAPYTTDLQLIEPAVQWAANAVVQQVRLTYSMNGVTVVEIHSAGDVVALKTYTDLGLSVPTGYVFSHWALSDGTAAEDPITLTQNTVLVASLTAISVTGVTLNKGETTLEEGAMEALTATVSPNNAADKRVVWTSSNLAVATVSTTGVVSGVSPGTATITATTVDGGFTDTCSVNIEAARVPVTGVSLSSNSLEMYVGDQVDLVAVIVPPDATNQNLRWESSNPAVASVTTSGKVICAAAGSTVISVTTDDGGFTSACSVVAVPKPVTEWVEVAGLKWAKRNLSAPGTFAETIYDLGMRYKFNNKVGWPTTGSSWNTNSYWAATGWSAANDPSPEGWRLPTGGPGGEQLKLEGVFSVWDSVNRGRWFADTESDLGDPEKSLFLPAAGLRNSSGAPYELGNAGFYWSSVPHSQTSLSYSLYFNSSNVTGANFGSAAFALAVRNIKID